MSDPTPLLKPAPTSPEAYQPCVGEEVLLHHESGVFPLRLKSLDVSIDDEVQRCFSLFFECATAQLAQGNFRLSHPRLGEFDLFLLPIQQKRNGPVSYQAVFNLLKDEAQ